MYRAYITRVTNIRPAENADRLNACEVFGNTTIIDKTITEDDTIVYFPSDGQISVEFGEKNNLFYRKDEAGNNVGGFIDPVKRRITAIRLRGNRSDGLVLPLSCLNYCYEHGDASAEFCVGDVIEGCVNGHDICQKYIPRHQNKQNNMITNNRTRKVKVEVAPLFSEHADTEQLAYNLSAFKPNDEIEITLKMHGTSQRTGYLPVFKGYKYKTRFEKWFAEGAKKYEEQNGDKMMPWDAKIYEWIMKRTAPIYDWGYVSGTRRTVLEDYEGGYYGSNAFREVHSKKFEGKLWKGETVYYEVVGFTDTGAPIMGSCGNEKLGKEFVKQYGKETIFSYGCDPDGGKETDFHDENCGAPYVVKGPQSDIYVYRMTMTNEDGNVIEYDPNFMRYRCEQMGIKVVPMYTRFILDEEEIAYDTRTPGEIVRDVCEFYYDGIDPVGKTHIKEGVVVRIINRPKFTAFKYKNYSFKVLSGIAVEKMEANGGEVSEDIASEM